MHAYCRGCPVSVVLEGPWKQDCLDMGGLGYKTASTVLMLVAPRVPCSTRTKQHTCLCLVGSQHSQPLGKNSQHASCRRSKMSSPVNLPEPPSRNISVSLFSYSIYIKINKLIYILLLSLVHHFQKICVTVT